MSRTTEGCAHEIDASVGPTSNVCEECGSAFNLRMCTTCGHVGCCESQQGHNTAHFRATGHSVIKSIPIEQGFTYCYGCRNYL